MSEEDSFIERRRHPRMSTAIGGLVRTSLGARAPVEICELSESGFSVTTDRGPVPRASGYSVKIDGLETLETTLRWRGNDEAGFEFARPLHPAVVDHLAAKHPPKRG
ncbi:hypothetical protein N0B51_10510 [Tsuneonella sp. YG55]|uniref:PilZ domain-containing protein n=1 Tax=Tsuneonella litorea TaxID=2976475 RepID=A0A9X3AA07_9SPHN|nr:PilZ domain-containing protein [Tsuneonella litorea]MCT2559410.1 hypothetical protein [Tsuneonella litorea]